MKSYRFILILLTLLSANAFGQVKRESFLEMVGNLSMGVERHTVNYRSQSGADVELLYSAGGGVGAQFGAGVFLNKNFVLKLDLHYQLSLAAQIEIINGNRTESSATFSRATISPGLYYNFPLKNSGILKGIEIGGNLEYHIPGKLKIVENNNTFEPISYAKDLGYRMRALGIIQLIEDRNLYLTTGLGFRGATNYSATTPEATSLNGSGLDFALGIRWFMGGE